MREIFLEAFERDRSNTPLGRSCYAPIDENIEQRRLGSPFCAALDYRLTDDGISPEISASRMPADTCCRRNVRRALFSVGLIALCVSEPAFAADVAASVMPWWGWPLALFVVCFALGIVAVPAGVGGGVLFVPIVGGFFPFHLDFVRGGGLLVALASALAASPGLLRIG